MSGKKGSLAVGGMPDVNRPQWKCFPSPFAGIDEAGRGCIAGPVAAGAVILPAEYDLPRLDDSKKLSARTRAELEISIKHQSLAWGVGFGLASGN